ncbi:MAG: recombination-associated protein RdgC [Chromatiales bacterium]
MWFKNLQLYRLMDGFDYSAESLHEKLLTDIAGPVQGLDMHTLGWDKPLGRDGQLLAHETNGCIMVCARKQERVLPSSVVRDILDEKIAEIEASEARTVRRKEKMQLKDEIIVDLLPRAFTRSSNTFAYIDKANGWVVVDSVSAKKAEDLLSLMRQSLGSFKVKPLEVNEAPSSILTHWLQSSAPTGFELQDECELRDMSEEGGAIIRCRRQDLDGDEIDVHLKAGKRVVKLAVSWQERLACILADDVSIKRLKFLDIVQEQAADAEADTAAARFDVDFAIMSLELRQFIDELIKIYGGLAEEQAAAAAA